jgi:anti-anti-sigma factor
MTAPIASNEYATITAEGNDAYVVRFIPPNLEGIQINRRIKSLLESFIATKQPGSKAWTLVLDLSTVQHFSSDMLGTFITVHKKLRAQGDHALVLAGVNPDISSVLGITALNRVFQVTKSVEEAVAQAQQPAIVDTIDGHIYVARPKQSQLVSPENIAALREQLGRVIGPAKRMGTPCTIIVDVTRLEKVSPAFWQALIALDHQLRSTENQSLMIANPTGEVMATIESQRLNQLFIIVSDLARAVVAASAPALPARMAG